MRFMAVAGFLMGAAGLALSVYLLKGVREGGTAILEVEGGLQQVATKVDAIPADVTRQIESEIGAARADTEVRVAANETRLRSLEQVMPSEVAIKAKVQDALKAVSQQYMGVKKVVDEVSDASLMTEDRIAKLEARVRKLEESNAILERLLRRVAAPDGADAASPEH
ncbi:MAG: hypothetical protein JW909_01740 [Planctomycetes bacterium]|nr:hypothetical protein [Planctomycetota bacterium]